MLHQNAGKKFSHYLLTTPVPMEQSGEFFVVHETFLEPHRKTVLQELY